MPEQRSAAKGYSKADLERDTMTPAKQEARSAASACEYGCSGGFLYDPRVDGNLVECPQCKVSSAAQDRDVCPASVPPPGMVNPDVRFTTCRCSPR